MVQGAPLPTSGWTGATRVTLPLTGFVLGALFLVAGAATGYAQHCTPPGCTRGESCPVLTDCLNGPTALGLTAEIAGVVLMGGSLLVPVVAAPTRRRVPAG